MTSRASNTARLELEISGVSEPLAVYRLQGEEGLSSLYTFTAHVRAKEALSGLFRRSAQLRILGSEAREDRLVHGIVHAVGSVGKTPYGRLYAITLAPAMTLLRHRQDFRIFQALTVEQIVKKVVAAAGLPGDAVRFILSQDHPRREYCVQYRESDWDFIHRILTEEGCFYFFEHREGAHTLIVGDAPFVHRPLTGGGGPLILGGAPGMVASEEQVLEFNHEESVGPGSFAARDYNYLQPGEDLDTSAAGTSGDNLEVYDFPGHYDAPQAGRARAQTRLHGLQAPLWRGSGTSGCPRLTPGYTFTLQGDAVTDVPELDDALLLVRVTHRGDQPQALGPDGAGQPSSYVNEFVCMPGRRSYRSPQAPKPFIPGPQTAVVTGPPGEEIFTDELGRVKVQFHWDRQGRFDDTSSCWLRVSQSWAGSGWGALWIPRIGHEVIVSFLDGDPDRPIVTGSVYHGTHAPPYALPDDRTRSGIRSESSPGGSGSNELFFEDRKGSEQVYLHAQRDWIAAVENDTTQTIGRDEARSVGRDRKTHIGRHQSEEIGVDKSIRVGHNHDESIGADMTRSVGANATVTVGMCKTETVALASAETVGAAKVLTVGAVYQVSVGAAMSETIALDKFVAVGVDSVEKIGKDRRITAGAEVEVIAGKSMSLQAAQDMLQSAGHNWKATGGKKGRIEMADELVIQVGSAIVTVKKNGQIYIGGSKVTLQVSGDVIIQGAKIKLN